MTMTMGPTPWVTPTPFSMATSETWSLGADFTAYLVTGDVITSPTTKLVDLTSGGSYGQVVILATSPTVLGNIISQVVPGSLLAPTHTYRLTWTATLNTNKVGTGALQINVPF